MTRYSPKQLATVLYELISEKPKARKEILSHFAVFLHKIEAVKMLSELERHFEIIHQKKENIIKVEIETAEKTFSSSFPKTINVKKVDSVWRHNPKLLAGTVIKIDDTRIDNSVKIRLENFKQLWLNKVF